MFTQRRERFWPTTQVSDFAAGRNRVGYWDRFLVISSSLFSLLLRCSDMIEEFMKRSVKPAYKISQNTTKKPKPLPPRKNLHTMRSTQYASRDTLHNIPHVGAVREPPICDLRIVRYIWIFLFILCRVGPVPPMSLRRSKAVELVLDISLLAFLSGVGDGNLQTQ